MDSDADKERKEDLNPRSGDIEERVKQMLDPSVPDAPNADNENPANTSVKSKSKIIAVSSAEYAEDTPLSAPTLPVETKKTSGKSSSKPEPSPKSKKVTIPILHDTASEPQTSKKEEPVPEANNIPEDPDLAAETSPVQEIHLDNDNKTPAEVAEKLDAAIADLDTTDEVETEPQELKSENARAEIEGDETPVNDPAVLTDPETDKAVDAIMADESDELLEIEDALRDSDKPFAPDKKQRRSLGQVLKSWWSKPAVRWLLIGIFVIGILGIGSVPSTRYFVLNTVGVRAASSLTVLDASTQQPLKNVKVSIGNNSATTDVNGKVQLHNIRLGDTTLTIEKGAFASVAKTIILGWGSNPLGDFKLTPTGSQYSFVVTDFLSGKPISKAEASSGDAASAISDDKGVIKLTIDKPDDQKLTITVKGENYRSEDLNIDPSDKSEHALKLVPSRKQVFISKRSGKYDMYSVYIDGKDEKLVLAGSGHEREDNLVIVPHPTANVVAYVSSRADQHNSDGFLLSNLILVNLNDNSTTNIGAAERMQIVDWSKDYLVYVQIASGASASSPKRYRLMSYNYQTDASKELASSNFFNDVIAASGVIYYAPSSAYQSGQTNFYKVNPDGSGSQVVYNQEVWNIFRTSYDHFALSVQQQWYDYKLGGSNPTKLNSAPSNQVTQVYIDSPDGKHSAWVDNRDGKGVLLVYDVATKTDTTIRAQTGITYPVRWLNDKVLVYRVKSPSETADYAISLDGGEPVKIRDVTNTGGIDRWYYY